MLKWLFRQNTEKPNRSAAPSAGVVRLRRGNRTDRIPASAALEISRGEIRSGRHRIRLYRFLADHLPVVSSCIWTWSRLASASGRLIAEGGDQAQSVLDRLSRRLYRSSGGQSVGVSVMLPDLFTSLFRDGCAGGFLLLSADGTRVDRFHLINPADLQVNQDSGKLELLTGPSERRLSLDRPDFFLTSLGDTDRHPTGRSILQPIPFVSYIEQQLVDDMRRASHNSGFHRLHVKITPPERYAGESDQGYVERINQYFDSTVGMIKSCQVDENPVTWDNVEIQYIGPENSRSVTNSWFMHHRAMVEEVAAGTNLAPFLLGYSYGATNTWSGFKFDLVMRQIRTVQAEVATLLEWIGNIELALHGERPLCHFEFDNNFPYQAVDSESIRSSRLESLLKLHAAGLIDESVAREKAEKLL